MGLYASKLLKWYIVWYVYSTAIKKLMPWRKLGRKEHALLRVSVLRVPPDW